jgi:hypothetical protein
MMHDEMPPSLYEIVATLDEMSNERRRVCEAVPSTARNSEVIPGIGEVLGCSYRKPTKNVEAQLSDEEFHSL